MFKTLITLLTTLTLLNFTSVQAAELDDCQPKNIKLWVTATFATAGDAVIIQNKKFKLIGVNSPQLEKKRKFNTTGQPLAKQSQTKLNQLLANHDLLVGVEYDTQKVDDFDRGLVHLFVKEKGKIINLNKLMLESGYALAKSEHNNNLHQICYYQAEKKARNAKIALWGLEAKNPQLQYPIAISSEISTADDGYRIYTGKILTVSKSSRNYILNMDTTGIRVPKKYWGNFNYAQLEALKGKTIEARGYGFLYKGAMFVRIQSPNAINLLNPVH